MRLTNSSIYTIVIILCIIGLPIVLIGSIIGIVRETRRISIARSHGDKRGYAQPKLLADIATLFFVLTLVAAGTIYGCIYYKLLSANLLWVAIALALVAIVCGLFAFVQRVKANNNAQN